jgi:hypothetical protein
MLQNPQKPFKWHQDCRFELLRNMGRLQGDGGGKGDGGI